MTKKQDIRNPEDIRHLIAIEIQYWGFSSTTTEERVAIRCPRIQARTKRKFIPINSAAEATWFQQAIYWLNGQDIEMVSFSCLGADKYIVTCNFSESNAIQEALK